MEKSISQLSLRVRTALVLIGMLLLVFLASLFSDIGNYIFLVVILIFVSLAAWELSRFTTRASNSWLIQQTYFLLFIFPSIAVFCITWRDGPMTEDLSASASVPVGLLAAVTGYLFSCIGVLIMVITGARRDLSAVNEMARDLMLGVFQVGFCGAFLLCLCMLPEHESVILWLLVVVFVNDTGAYFIGSRLKGPKLAPIVSPNKTISGSLGGIVTGIAAGLLGSGLLSSVFKGRWYSLIALGLVLIVAAQVGDLSKSLLKRSYGVKDTGDILPGHGGILDRIDGLLLAAPVLYLWLLLVQ